LAALRFISSAESTIATRHAPIAGVMCMNSLSPRTSSTTISLRMRLVQGASCAADGTGRVRARIDQRAAGRLACDIESVGCAEQAALLPRQQEAREAPGKRRLADAARPGQQPGVVQLAYLLRRQQRALGGLVPDQPVVAPRRRPVVRPFELSSSDGRRSAWPVPWFRCPAARRRGALPPGDVVDVLRGIDDRAAAGLGPGDLEETPAHALVESRGRLS
jgi:hypothetical protein